MSKEAFELQGNNTVESHERETGLRFLIVEDNPANIQAAQEYLSQRQDEQTRITVEFVKDYDEAVKHIEQGKSHRWEGQTTAGLRENPPQFSSSRLPSLWHHQKWPRAHFMVEVTVACASSRRKL